MSIKKKIKDYLSHPYAGAILSLVGAFLSLLGMILSLFGVIIPLINRQISLTPIISMVSLLVVVIAIAILFARRKVELFANRDNAGKTFNIDSIFKEITKNKLDITIAGRTNITWFKDRENKQKLYENAIKNGCRIKFIIQHDYVKNTAMDDKQKQEMAVEHNQAIESFMFIYEYLKRQNACQNVDDYFKMFLTQDSVNNSITYLYSGRGPHRLSLDIGLNLKPDLKPILIFRKVSVLPELIESLIELERKSINLFDYNRRYNEAKKEVDGALKGYLQFSEQRSNHCNKLMHHYYKRKRSLEENVFYPPASIQLLITNKCTARCIMCSHHAINSQNELKLSEIENVLDYIVDIGTKNIIISGGEPLYRMDCLEILEKAKSKNINIGLLTNGIKYNGESLTINEAEKIRDACDWIQISIDSFRQDIYKQIRNVDINIVKESLSSLERVNANLEIAFTIQKSNIDEAIEIIKADKTAFDTPTKIRFKFAHGPNNNKNDFLLSGKESELRNFLGNCRKSNRFNTEYIAEMFERYFNEEDIINGTPLRKTNNSFKYNNYICHVLNYSCKIDAEGNLYPCCFLYDDNVGENSEIRNKYKLGSLRTDAVIKPLEKGTNKLKELLDNNIYASRKDTIPIQEQACDNCTRHFYQNAFLNKLNEVTERYKDINFSYPETESFDEKIWI